MKKFSIFYIAVLVCTAIFSWGFVDPGLFPWMSGLAPYQRPLSTLVFVHRSLTSGIFIFLLSGFTYFYLTILGKIDKEAIAADVKRLIAITAAILFFSFPAFSYDIFNYVTTAKMFFVHRENPYIVKPVEIPNDPNLSFTRAANKVALYGPVWIGLTGIPQLLGRGNIWLTIASYKLMHTVLYLLFCLFIFRQTRSLKNVIFFAFNPLVLIEVLISSHNDIVMMMLGLLGVVFYGIHRWRHRLAGMLLFVFSICIKGATAVLVPLFFIQTVKDKKFFLGFVLMLIFFFVVAPLREELYPWYAVWFLSFASLLPFKKYPIAITVSLILSVSLELRHVPYMMLLSYEGWGPGARWFVSYVPLGIYLAYVLVLKKFLCRKNG